MGQGSSPTRGGCGSGAAGCRGQGSSGKLWSASVGVACHGLMCRVILHLRCLSRCLSLFRRRLLNGGTLPPEACYNPEPQPSGIASLQAIAAASTTCWCWSVPSRLNFDLQSCYPCCHAQHMSLSLHSRADCCHAFRCRLCASVLLLRQTCHPCCADCVPSCYLRLVEQAHCSACSAARTPVHCPGCRPCATTWLPRQTCCPCCTSWKPPAAQL